MSQVAPKPSGTLNRKGNNFLSAQTSERVKVACFAVGAFCMREIFS